MLTPPTTRSVIPMVQHLAVEFEWYPIGALSIEAGKISFPSVDDGPGIYRFDLFPADGEPTAYIGEAERLRRRFQHYRTPGPTQQTNIRLNKRVVDLLDAGGSAAVSTCTSALAEMGSEWRPLDLEQKFSRVLLEHAALMLVNTYEGTPVENL